MSNQNNKVDLAYVNELIQRAANYSPIRGRVVESPDPSSELREYITFRKPSPYFVVE